MDAERKGTRDWLVNAGKTPFTKVIDEAKITPRQKQIIMLKYIDGLSNIQISMRLHIAVETVRNDLRRAYNNITKVLLTL